MKQCTKFEDSNFNGFRYIFEGLRNILDQMTQVMPLFRKIICPSGVFGTQLVKAACHCFLEKLCVHLEICLDETVHQT